MDNDNQGDSTKDETSVVEDYKGHSLKMPETPTNELIFDTQNNMKITKEDEIDLDSLRYFEFQDHVSDFAPDVQTPALEEPEISNIFGSSLSLLNPNRPNEFNMSMSQNTSSRDNLNSSFIRKSNSAKEYGFIHSLFGRISSK